MYTRKMLCNAFFAVTLQDNLRSCGVNTSHMTTMDHIRHILKDSINQTATWQFLFAQYIYMSSLWSITPNVNHRAVFMKLSSKYRDHAKSLKHKLTIISGFLGKVVRGKG